MNLHPVPYRSSRPQPRKVSAFSAALALSLVACSDGAEPGASGDGDGDSMTETGAGGASAAGGTLSSGGTDGAGGSDSATGGEGAGTGGAESVDPIDFASELDGLVIDRPCDDGTSLPLANGAVCDHKEPLHVEETSTFGGEMGTTYAVTLRVRGIWEPTNIDGGELPDTDIPFNVGGDVAAGNGGDSDAINYQQFYIVVSSPAQTYWLNNHDYVAHDIHKEDYEAILLVDGGAEVTVIANDGNERQIANFPQEYFDDLPPYDQTPSLGQFLHLDVLDVEIAP